MKLFYIRSNNLSFLIILLGVLISCGGNRSFFPNLTYAQSFATQSDDSGVYQENGGNSLESAPSGYFFGKRNEASKPKFAFSSITSSGKDAVGDSRKKSDYGATLKKFFGLNPRKDSTSKARVGYQIGSPIQGFPPQDASFEQFADRVQSQSERLSDGLREFSDQTNQELNAVRSGAETARRKVDSSFHELQHQGREIARDVQDQFQDVQEEVRKKAHEIDRQGRQVVRNAENHMRQEFDDAQNLVSQRMQDLRRETHSRLATFQNNNVDAAILANRQALAKARRQRLDELNEILAAARPDEFALREETRRTAEIAADTVAAQVNRSKIRQASNVELKSNVKKPSARSATHSKANSLPRDSMKRPLLANESYGDSSNNPNAMRRALYDSNFRPKRGVEQRDSEQINGAQVGKLTNFQNPASRQKKSFAVFSEPSTSENGAENDYSEDNDDESVEDSPRDVIKNGVIRSSASFIDPKDL